MTPEKAAEMARALEQHVQGRPDAAATLQHAINHANSDGAARLVIDQVASPRSVALLSTTYLDVPKTNALLDYFQLLVTRAAHRLERELDEAVEIVCYEISSLLDRHAPHAVVIKAAHKHAGKLRSAEVEAVVAREQAWWVRLHAQLEGAHA